MSVAMGFLQPAKVNLSQILDAQTRMVVWGKVLEMCVLSARGRREFCFWWLQLLKVYTHISHETCTSYKTQDSISLAATDGSADVRAALRSLQAGMWSFKGLMGDNENNQFFFPYLCIWKLLFFSRIIMGSYYDNMCIGHACWKKLNQLGTPPSNLRVSSWLSTVVWNTAPGGNGRSNEVAGGATCRCQRIVFQDTFGSCKGGIASGAASEECRQRWLSGVAVVGGYHESGFQNNVWN